MSSNGLACVTGATSGIGKAIAMELARAGYPLWITGRRENRLRELKEQLESDHGIKVHFDAVDFRDLEQLQHVLESRRDLFNDAQVLIQSAGLALGVDPMDHANFSDWDTMITVNVRALLLIDRYLIPFLKKQSQADIIHIGSVAGRWVYPGGGVYCSTKHAVRALTEGLRLDLMGSSVRVMNIEPGMVETEFSEVRLGDRGAAQQVYKGMKPLVAEDIAECAVWMLSRPRHVTIQEIVVFPSDQGGVGYIQRD